MANTDELNYKTDFCNLKFQSHELLIKLFLIYYFYFTGESLKIRKLIGGELNGLD